MYVAETGCRTFVAGEADLPRFADLPVVVVAAGAGGEALAPPAVPDEGTADAYVIYTSGSTATP
jgi:non-ribosomal peptide synthetase component F